MKIGILAPSPVPFVVGGAEGAWAGLYRELMGRAGVQAELIKLPSPERNLFEVMASYRQWYEFRADQFDRIVTGKYPAWMTPHDDKVVYLLHPLRGLYDTYPGGRSLALQPWRRNRLVHRVIRQAESLSRGSTPAELFGAWAALVDEVEPDHPAFAFPGPLAQLLVRSMDSWAMTPPRAKRWLTISQTVANRANYLPAGVPVQALPHPSDLANLHRSSAQEFFFTASRLEAPKRVDLIIAAMRAAKTQVPLVIAGTGPDEDRLRNLADGDARITFAGRLSQAELVDHYARALAVLFAPKDEDLGLITLEAMGSGVPVITTTDSGGPTEFVVDERNGLVCTPEPGAMAAAIDRLASDPDAAARLGDVAADSVREITWSRVADAVLAPAPVPVRRPRLRPSGSRPRILVLAPFRVGAPRNGGQARVHHLSRALTPTYEVDVLSLVGRHEPAGSQTIAPGFREHVVNRSVEQDLTLGLMAGLAHVNVEDILSGGFSWQSPRFGERLNDLLDSADAVILEHPYLLPALARAGGTGLPVIHHAHNVELDLKTSMLPTSAAREDLLRLVQSLEAEATRSSDVTVCVSEPERDRLLALYPADKNRLALVPNGVDLDATPFAGTLRRKAARDHLVAQLRSNRPELPETESTGVFVGSWHGPNIDAARFLIKLYSELPRRHVLILAGSVCEALAGTSTTPNVFLLGHVSEAALSYLLTAADLALNPMEGGAGSNLKVAQYLAAGIPVVSTEFGLRGFAPPPNVVATCENGDLARFLADSPQWNPGAENLSEGRRYAEQFDWKRLGVAYRDAVHGICP